MFGTCVTQEECSARTGGSAAGNCASGFGVCCFTEITTGQVFHNTTYIRNTEFPSTFGAAAPVTAANRAFQIMGGPDIKQVRIDFDTAVFTQPALASGDCANDVISVTGSSRANNLGFNELCGTLSGQHIYIDAAQPTTAAVLNINTDATVFGRTWKLLVTTLEAGSLSLAPSGCLQYFFGSPGGSIQSFNHVSTGTTLGQLIDNLQYTACIRQEKGFNCITYQEALPADNPDKFTLLHTNGNAAKSQVGETQVAATGVIMAGCTTQHLVIPGTTNPATGLPPIGDVFCSGLLNQADMQAVAGPVTSRKLPFEIGVFVSDSTALGGFDLVYSQENCQ